KSFSKSRCLGRGPPLLHAGPCRCRGQRGLDNDAIAADPALLTPALGRKGTSTHAQAMSALPSSSFSRVSSARYKGFPYTDDHATQHSPFWHIEASYIAAIVAFQIFVVPDQARPAQQPPQRQREPFLPIDGH